jgi:hypothetical protein
MTLGSACILFVVPQAKLPPALKTVDNFGPMICGLLIVWLPVFFILLGVAQLIEGPDRINAIFDLAHALLPVVAYFAVLMGAAPVAYDELFVLATPGPSGITKMSVGQIWFLSFFTGGLYPLAWMIRVRGELVKSFNADIPPSWHLIVPILNILWLWKWAGGVQTATGGKTSQVMAFVFIWILGLIGISLLQSTFNQLGGGAPMQPQGYPPQGGGYPGQQPGGYPQGQPWQ